MLHIQLRPLLASSVSWGVRSKGLDNGCQFCAASRIRSEAAGPALWKKTRARSKQVFAVWCQFGGSRLQRRGEDLRFGCRQLPSRRTSCTLMAKMEDATENPLITEDSSVTYLRGNESDSNLGVTGENQYMSTVALPSMVPSTMLSSHISIVDQAFLLLGFIACSASFALFALIVTAIPTLHAMRKAAMSVEKLADIAREELPGTTAAIRLSGMEISDLTLELNDLSQEISDGVRNSARSVQAAEVGIRRIGSVAASQTFAMLQETANVPVQVVRPAVVSAAVTTLHAVSQAQKLVFSLASSSYPHISGWLGQRGNQSKRQKPAAQAPSSTASLTELLEEEMAGASLLSNASQLSMFDDIEGDEGDEGSVIRVQAASDN